MFLVLGGAGTAQAQGRIDFDQIPLEAIDGGTLVVPDADPAGTDVTFSGPGLRLVDLLAFAGDPRFAGQALITWQWPQQDGITIRFSRPVARVGIAGGDFQGDADGPLTLRAFDCGGREVGAASAAWADGQGPPFARVEVEAPRICSAIFTSGGEHAGSAFLDDVTFVAAGAF